MSLSDRLVRRRPVAPIRPDKANFSWQLREGAQQEYADALFLGEVDEALDDPQLAELIRGIGSGEYVRSMCRGRKDKIIMPVAEPLASAWTALARLRFRCGVRRRGDGGLDTAVGRDPVRLAPRCCGRPDSPPIGPRDIGVCLLREHRAGVLHRLS